MKAIEHTLYGAFIALAGVLSAVMTMAACMLIWGENVITARTLYSLADKADLDSPVTVDGKAVEEVGLFYDEDEKCVRLEIRTKKVTDLAQG